MDSSGFSLSREHWKKMQYKIRNRESEFVRLFISNVPKIYSVDDVYNHFMEQEVKIVDLWQSSHVDARRKSFVVKVSRNEVENVINDKVLEGLRIGVREYSNRSEQ